jgi:hypothetical protein
MMLDFYANSKPGRFETIEGIDTLCFIDYGKKLLFIKADNCDSLSVDTSADLVMVRKIIEKEMPPPPTRPFLYRRHKWLKCSFGLSSSFSRRRAA